VSTLERRLSAINQVHRQTGYEAPASRRDEPRHSVWAGLVRTKGVAPEKVAPALPDDLRAMVEALPREATPSSDDGELTFRSKRDRAHLLVGFAGALRRSALVAVEADPVQSGADGMRPWLPRSKADQEGHGAVLGVHYGQSPLTCPVRALRSWLQAAREHTGAPLGGPVFRKVDRWGTLWETGLTSGAVAKLVKKAASRAGLDPALYSGHSLRAGFATQAARAGKHERAIMAHTRHESECVLRE
jgi:integrase